MNETHAYTCPYCGEANTTELDLSGLAPGETQQYIEDCSVCCRPIVIAVATDFAGGIGTIDIERDNE